LHPHERALFWCVIFNSPHKCLVLAKLSPTDQKQVHSTDVYGQVKS